MLRFRSIMLKAFFICLVALTRQTQGARTSGIGMQVHDNYIDEPRGDTYNADEDEQFKTFLKRLSAPVINSSYISWAKRTVRARNDLNDEITSGQEFFPVVEDTGSGICVRTGKNTWEYQKRDVEVLGHMPLDYDSILNLTESVEVTKLHGILQPGTQAKVLKVNADGKIHIRASSGVLHVGGKAEVVRNYRDLPKGSIVTVTKINGIEALTGHITVDLNVKGYRHVPQYVLQPIVYDNVMKEDWKLNFKPVGNTPRITRLAVKETGVHEDVFIMIEGGLLGKVVVEAWFTVRTGGASCIGYRIYNTPEEIETLNNPEEPADRINWYVLEDWTHEIFPNVKTFFEQFWPFRYKGDEPTEEELRNDVEIAYDTGSEQGYKKVTGYRLFSTNCRYFSRYVMGLFGKHKEEIKSLTETTRGARERPPGTVQIWKKTYAVSYHNFKTVCGKTLWKVRRALS